MTEPVKSARAGELQHLGQQRLFLWLLVLTPGRGDLRADQIVVTPLILAVELGCIIVRTIVPGDKVGLDKWLRPFTHMFGPQFTVQHRCQETGAGHILEPEPRNCLGRLRVERITDQAVADKPGNENAQVLRVSVFTAKNDGRIAVTHDGMITHMQYRLGLPAWRFPDWENLYFDAHERLRQYASVFSCVEGNTTFYATPSAATVADWRAQLEGLDFQFNFKLPRQITHESGKLGEVKTFLAALEPVHASMGPLLVQLPASTGPADIGWIRKLLEQIPADFGAALEVRHPGFFDEPDRFHEMLADTGCFHTMMDARPIHLHDQGHPEVLAARHEKPDVPVLAYPTNGGAMVRVVLHPDDSLNDSYYDFWVDKTAEWLLEGDAVYMMIHCPNNLHCPAQALRFHRMLQQKLAAGGKTLEDLPDWPVSQQSLF